MLDVHKVVKHRLFRESCFNHKGTYVKVIVLENPYVDELLIWKLCALRIYHNLAVTFHNL